MKRARVILMIGVVLACGSAAVAETVGTHKVYLPGDIKWGPAPSSLPAGAEAAVTVRRPCERGHVRASNQGAKGLSHSSTYAFQTRDSHGHLGQARFGHGASGGSRQGRIVAGWQLLVDARRRRPLRLRRRRDGHSDQRDRALGHRLCRPKERSPSKRGAVKIARLWGDARSPWKLERQAVDEPSAASRKMKKSSPARGRAKSQG